MAWVLREIISFILQDCNADMTLLRARSRKRLTQIPKLSFISLSEELKAYYMDKCRYRDNE